MSGNHPRGLILCLNMREEGNFYSGQHRGFCEPNLAVCFSVSAVDGVSVNAVLAML